MGQFTYVNTFSIVTFMGPKYKSSIADEQLASDVRCAISIKYRLDFENNMK